MFEDKRHSQSIKEKSNSTLHKNEDIITTGLSFVVSLIDDYTGNAPLGNIDVSLKINKGKYDKDLKKPIRKERGQYWLFLDSQNNQDDDLSLVVSSLYYFDVKIPHNYRKDIAESQNYYRLPNDNNTANIQQAKYPIINIRLRPLPSYPFPSHATLIRGVIQDTEKNPISNVEIHCPEFDDDIFFVSSTKKGEFVYYLRIQNTAKLWSLQSSKLKEKLINFNRIIVTMRFTHQNFKEQSIKINIIEGRSCSAGIIALTR